MQLKGYCLPLSPEGRAQAVDPPPWHYGGDVIQVVFKPDPDQIKRVLPSPLRPHPEGLGLIWFVEWVSVSELNPELAYLNPERSQYKECLVAVQCTYDGEEGFTVPYIWVDNDFTLLRGWFQGFPKKLGRIYITRHHPLNPKMGALRPGVKMKGILEAHGERLAEASLEITGEGSMEELPKPKFFLLRHYPSIEDPAKPAVFELVRSIVENVRYGPVWRGRGEVKFYHSLFEELDALSPVEVLNGHFFSLGITIKGGVVLYRFPK
ncbi:MAG: acetoacetate decarboxylase family protein [Candidatus Nezhaarchaeota archaeon]|nr:acetoacetate decarboxylase family protein [Candidatus Nezhaarchaeota archaeon]